MSGGGKGDMVVTFLAALVKVKDGAPVTVLKGEPLPDNIAAGEVKRLAGLGALGRRKVEAEAPADDAGNDGAGEAAATIEFDIDGADTPALAKFLMEGKGGKPFNVSEVLAFAEVEGDAAATAARARHILEAEQHATGNDGRDTLTAPLAKLIEADPAAAGS